jgi:malonate transporter
MTGIASLSLPLFGVVALGWVAKRIGLVTVAALDALAAYSFRFALPALVFRLIAGQPLTRSFEPVFYAGYLVAGSLAFAGVLIAFSVLGRWSFGRAGACAATATVGNLGFLGPPLMLSFFGEPGAGPLAMAMAILAEVMVLLSIAAVMMSAAQGGAVGTVRLLVRVTMLNPVVVAIGLGAAVAAAGFALPAPADTFLGLLGASAGPTALFALGGTLAVQRIGRKTMVAVAGITAVKLVIYPLLVWYVLTNLLRMQGFWVQAGVVLAALPSAGSTYVVAQRFASDAPPIAAAIAVSTVLSAVTVPLTAWVVFR